MYEQLINELKKSEQELRNAIDRLNKNLANLQDVAHKQMQFYDYEDRIVLKSLTL